MLKQVGKIENDILERADILAAKLGITRRLLIERLILQAAEEDVGLQDVAPPSTEAESQQEPVEPRPSDNEQTEWFRLNRERRAFVCLNPAHQKSREPYRVFLTPGEPYRVPQCPEHGQMTRQRNNKYMGKELATFIPENFPQVIAEI